ncbi:MAG TPA: cation diffusion facilitator family transporter [Thermodesulfovibrionales bacterium]|nr:cation diffusion facilitator family transporter [Thermodesulfovibrionales bacterium]
MDRETTDRSAAIRRVLWITLFCNICVSGAKIGYGYFSHSVSITADGFHSMFDGVSNIMGFVGIYFAFHPPDEEHPYGHRKIETIFTIFIGVMMSLACFEIFKQVYESIKSEPRVSVTPESFLIMITTLGVNIFVTTYEKRMGNKLNSEFLIADAQHTKSDIYATTGVIAGLVLMKLGFTRADTIVGTVVGILVARAGIGILKEAADVLADRRQVDTQQIKKIVCGINNVVDCHRVRTRGTNSCIFIDLHVTVSPDISVSEGHKIAHIAEERIKGNIKAVVDVVVHIEPLGSEADG